MDKIGSKHLYGTQTAAALENFGGGTITYDFIRAYGEVKKAALIAIQKSEHNYDDGVFEALMESCDAVIDGTLKDQFVLGFMQGGAGTSVNMNVNEVIANYASFLLSENGAKIDVDPIRDINRYQSTNDTFTTALTIMCLRHLNDIEELVIRLQEELVTLESRYNHVVASGRTEMQDALPITVGQVFGGYAGAVERDRWRLNKLKERVRSVALGGTAIGTCYAASQDYIYHAEKELRKITGLPLCRSQNLVDEISNTDKYGELAGGYELVAVNLFKIAGDLLIYTSSMTGEMSHPELQWGSTIMAAKTNPVILEMVRGLAVNVRGECYKIRSYCENGQLQLNPYLPFVMESFSNIHLSLKRSITCLIDKFLKLVTINEARIKKNLVSGKSLINALIQYFDYDVVKRIYSTARERKAEDLEHLVKIISEVTGVSLERAERIMTPFYLTGSIRELSDG